MKKRVNNSLFFIPKTAFCFIFLPPEPTRIEQVLHSKHSKNGVSVDVSGTADSRQSIRRKDYENIKDYGTSQRRTYQ